MPQIDLNTTCPFCLYTVTSLWTPTNHYIGMVCHNCGETWLINDVWMQRYISTIAVLSVVVEDKFG